MDVMGSSGIELAAVTKRYGRRLVLDDVSFACEAGTVTAFCGPNGAGKSTALRVLVGIAQPTSGQALVRGVPVRKLRNPGRTIGVLLDAAAFHPGRSVRESLRLGAMTVGQPAARADDWMGRVGLESVAARRVGKLSLGMRQRLGIAHALLGDPGVLVLDEPSNGLDPAGMLWLDGLVRDFADDGGTVLLSTHHLAAVERIADRAVAISKGRIVGNAAIADARSAASTRVAALDRVALEAALTVAGYAYERDRDGFVVDAAPDELGRMALDARIVLRDLRDVGPGLGGFVAERTEAEFAGSAR
jgi:ABC-2 type transport system ATP-binding protein